MKFTIGGGFRQFQDCHNESVSAFASTYVSKRSAGIDQPGVGTSSEVSSYLYIASQRILAGTPQLLRLSFAP